MLFGFRGIRAFQLILALGALASGVGMALTLKAFADGSGALLIVPGVLLGLVFLWLFAAALRAPTSFVAVAEDRTRIRFAGFIDTVVLNSDIAGVTLVNRNILYGLGVRLTFPGIALMSAWGEIAEIHFHRPVRVWLVPRLIPLRTRRLGVSVRNPAKLVDRLGRPKVVSPGTRPARRMKNRGPRTR